MTVASGRHVCRVSDPIHPKVLVNRIPGNLGTGLKMDGFLTYQDYGISLVFAGERRNPCGSQALRLPMQVVRASVALSWLPTVGDTAILRRSLSGLRGDPPGVPAGVLDAAPPVRVTFFADRFLDGHATRL